jgi:hypothetical protein
MAVSDISLGLSGYPESFATQLVYIDLTHLGDTHLSLLAENLYISFADTNLT